MVSDERELPPVKVALTASFVFSPDTLENEVAIEFGIEMLKFSIAVMLASDTTVEVPEVGVAIAIASESVPAPPAIV